MTQLLQRPGDEDSSTPKPPPTHEEQREALRRLVLVIVAGVLAAIATHTTKTVLVIVAIMTMIMLHELGHFVMAKVSGMKVTEFFLGFGPRLWSVRKGETEYGVKAIVLAGGYNRILGMTNLEEVDPEDEPRTYREATYPRKLATIAAGSVMHFVLALVLLFALNSAVGVIHPLHGGAQVHAVERFATGKSPAEQAGLEPGDRIMSADGHPFNRDDLTIYIREHPGRPMVLDVVRKGHHLTTTVTPADVSAVKAKDTKGVPSHAGFVGISVGEPYRIDRANPLLATARAGRDLGRITWLSLRGIGDLVSFHGIRSYGDQLTGHVSSKPSADQPRLLSPVGLVRVASEAASNGLRDVLYLLVAINVFVGMLNMLPLLPFDGGHIAVATYERIRSRRGERYHVDITKLMPITYAVVMLLFFVTIASLYLDIVHPLKLQ